MKKAGNSCQMIHETLRVVAVCSKEKKKRNERKRKETKRKDKECVNGACGELKTSV